MKQKPICYIIYYMDCTVFATGPGQLLTDTFLISYFFELSQIVDNEETF